MPREEHIFPNWIEQSTVQCGTYHHIPLDESLIPKTAFTSLFGKYKYTKVPFGLMQTPAYLPRTHDRYLKGFLFHHHLYRWHHYLQQNGRRTLNHIKHDLEKLRNAHLSMKLSKCHFFTKEIQYLGHILSTKGIRPLPSKTQAINNMHPPKTAKQVYTSPGFIRYYRKFIKNFAKMPKPLTLLTHHKGKIWMDTNTPYSLFDTKGISYANTYSTLSRSSKMIQTLHRCIKTMHVEQTLTRKWWNGISNIFSFAYFHRYIEVREHHRTKSLQRYITQSPNWTITSKEKKLLFTMTNKPLQDFSIERMPITK